MTTKQLYDDLIFKRYRGEYTKNAHDINYQDLVKHVTDRFQLDFYPGNWQIETENHELWLKNIDHIDNDFVEYQANPHDIIPAHVRVINSKIKLPMLSQGTLSPQTIYTVISPAQTTMHRHTNRTRLERILKSVQQLIDYTPMIKQINQMYQQTVIKQIVVLDTGLSTEPLTAKGLSYLKTNFRKIYNKQADQLFVTNSRKVIGDLNLAITPFEINDRKLTANEFADLINNEQLTKKQHDLINGSSFDLTQVGYHKIEWHQGAKPKVQWLDRQVTQPKASDDDPKEVIKAPQPEPKVQPEVKKASTLKLTKPVADKHDDKLTITTNDQSATTSMYPTENKDLDDYNTSRSVTEVIKKHTAKNRNWSNQVIISHVGD